MSRRREFAEPLSVSLRPIGYMRSPHKVHHDAPRQPLGDPALGDRALGDLALGDPALGDRAPGDGEGAIEIVQGLQNGLADLAGFSHVWALFLCHHTRGWNSKVMPPRDRQKRGVFATRAPARPNPIGLSCLRLLGIDKRIVRVGRHDILDGTPILDLKPYLPYCDSVPDAAIGWVASLPADAPDHRPWWEQKSIAPPKVYARRRQPKPD